MRAASADPATASLLLLLSPLPRPLACASSPPLRPSPIPRRPPTPSPPTFRIPPLGVPAPVPGTQASLEQKNNAIVAEYGEGDSFGELALLYNSPRAATVTCFEGGRVWALERKRFR